MNIFTNFFSYIKNPALADADPIDWAAFAVLAVLAGLLWSKVVKQTVSAV